MSYDPASIRRQLEDVAQARQDDRITAEEATSLETELIQRLLTAHQRTRVVSGSHRQQKAIHHD